MAAGQVRVLYSETDGRRAVDGGPWLRAACWVTAVPMRRRGADARPSSVASALLTMAGGVLVTQGADGGRGDRMVVNMRNRKRVRSKGACAPSSITGDNERNAGTAFTVTEGSSGLRVDKLRKSYKRRPVTCDVSMNLDRGEVVALLGRTGSGKTTVFLLHRRSDHPRWGGTSPSMGPTSRSTRCTAGRRGVCLGIGYLPQGKCRSFAACRSRTNIMAILEIAEPKRGAPQGTAGGTSVGVLDRAYCAGRPPCPCRRRTAPAPKSRAALRPNPRLRAARRAFAGVDPIAVGDIRHLVSDLKDAGDRRSDHRSQCSRNPRDRRPRLYPA